MAGSHEVRASGGRAGGVRRRRPVASPPARVALLLLGVAGLLVALSLATRYGAYRAEVAAPGSAQVAAWKVVMKLFDVNSENNVPTWFSSLLLFGDALLAGLVAALVRRAGGRDAGHWAALAVLLSLLSLDEVASLHERLPDPATALRGAAVAAVAGRGRLAPRAPARPGHRAARRRRRRAALRLGAARRTAGPARRERLRRLPHAAAWQHPAAGRHRRGRLPRRRRRGGEPQRDGAGGPGRPCHVPAGQRG